MSVIVVYVGGTTAGAVNWLATVSSLNSNKRCSLPVKEQKRFKCPSYIKGKSS